LLGKALVKVTGISPSIVVIGEAHEAEKEEEKSEARCIDTS
jgi:hypothetical protein